MALELCHIVVVVLKTSFGEKGLLWTRDSSCSCPLGSLAGCTGCDNYHCQFGPAPESGMGAVYANGFRAPSGVLLSILRSAQGRQLVKMSVTAVAMLEAKGVYALAWYQGEHVAELVLSNPSPNVIYGLPFVLELIPTAIRVLKAMRLAQSSNESRDVSGLDGFNSTVVPLLGTVLPAAKFKGPASKKLKPLKPYQVLKLWILFKGCSNSLRRLKINRF